MATRKLTFRQVSILQGILTNPNWPNECRFEERETYITKMGKTGCRKYDRRSYEPLFDQDLLEAVRCSGYTYTAGYPASGILRVTEKGKQAIESGKYEAVVCDRVKVEKPSDFTPNRSPFTDLPRIILVEGISDAGPMESGGTFCPHCGAEGRFVYHFICEGGERAAAMRGCFKMWPKHQFAEIAANLKNKEREYAERSKKSGREWRLCSWDRDILNAIEMFADGTLSESETSQRIHEAKLKARTYRERRKNRR